MRAISLICYLLSDDKQSCLFPRNTEGTRLLLDYFTSAQDCARTLSFHYGSIVPREPELKFWTQNVSGNNAMSRHYVDIKSKLSCVHTHTQAGVLDAVCSLFGLFFFFFYSLFVCLFSPPLTPLEAS